MNDETKAKGCAFMVAIFIILIVFGIGATFKGCFAKQSGIRSRFGGDNVILEVPDDCEKIINMSKSNSTKYLVYLTKDGTVLMKEYSNYGILQCVYELDKKVNTDLKVKKKEEK